MALVNGAKFFDVTFVKRDEENYIYLNYKGKERVFKLLNILEFTSARKRMSVIIENENKQKVLLTKGADSIILGRL